MTSVTLNEKVSANPPEEGKDVKPEPVKEILDVTSIVAGLAQDNIALSDVKKHENDEDMKKLKKKYKKLAKDVNSFYTGKLDPKDKIFSIFDKFQKLAKDCKALNEKFIVVRSNYTLAASEKEKVQEDHKKN